LPFSATSGSTDVLIGGSGGGFVPFAPASPGANLGRFAAGRCDWGLAPDGFGTDGFGTDGFGTDGFGTDGFGAESFVGGDIFAFA